MHGVLMQSLLRVFVLMFVIDLLSELCHLILIMWQDFCPQRHKTRKVHLCQKQDKVWHYAHTYKKDVFVWACHGRDSV